MEVTGMSKLATSIADSGTRQDVDLALLKRAQQIESATATQLLEAIQPPQTVQNLPAHLGNKINTTA
jgi:hypothetical protein